MKCDKAVLWLSDYIDELLTTENKKQLEEHIHQCNSCASELQQLERTVDLIKNLPRTRAPKNLREEISHAIEPVPWLRVYRNFSLAAGLLFSFTLGMWFLIYQERITLATESVLAESDSLSSGRENEKRNEQPTSQQTVAKNEYQKKPGTNPKQDEFLRKRLGQEREKALEKKSKHAVKSKFKAQKENLDLDEFSESDAAQKEEKSHKIENNENINRRVLNDSPLAGAGQSFGDENIVASTDEADQAEVQGGVGDFDQAGAEIQGGADFDQGIESEDIVQKDIEQSFEAAKDEEEYEEVETTVKDQEPEPTLARKDNFFKKNDVEEIKAEEKNALVSAPRQTQGVQFKNKIEKKTPTALNRDSVRKSLFYKNKNKEDFCSRCHVKNIDLMHEHLAKKISPINLYQQLINCNDCHTILSEQLIESGHSIPKNNISSLFDDEDSKIAEQIFVVQKMVQLELSLRGLSTAKTEGKFVVYMRRTISVIYAQLKANTYIYNEEYVKEVLRRLRSTELRIGNSIQLLALANYIKQKAPTASFLPVKGQLQVEEQHVQPRILEEADENIGDDSDQ